MSFIIDEILCEGTIEGSTVQTTGGANLGTHVADTTNPHATTKAQVGLGNADDTSDANKPVSTAQALADTAVQNFSIQRANHTGTQAAATVTGLATVATSGSHLDLSNIGTNTHAQVDTHIASTANPHAVTIAQVTPLTTKGDVMVRNATVTTRLPVGTNSQVLTADSSAAEGVKWSTPALGNSPIVLSLNDNNTPFLSTATTSYKNLAEILFAGSGSTGAITKIEIVGGSSNAVTSASFKIFDRTNGLTIAELTGAVGVTRVILNLGAITNVPAAAAVFEVQALRVGAGASAEISSLKITF